MENETTTILACPYCKTALNHSDYISEPDIFTKPMNLVCASCGKHFAIQARIIEVEWHIK